jgi:dTDP-4-amino-4,6-dideoxygalactose transaminase
MLAAYLFAQLEQKDQIQKKRKTAWDAYYEKLAPLEKRELIKLPHLPNYAINNAHIFYLVCKDLETRTAFISHMKANQVQTPFHYVALHNSPYYFNKHDGRTLPWVTVYQDHLVRLPLFAGIEMQEIERVCELTLGFFNNN